MSLPNFDGINLSPNLDRLMRIARENAAELLLSLIADGTIKPTTPAEEIVRILMRKGDNAASGGS